MSSHSTESENYIRVRITGTLTARSPLHVGDGATGTAGREAANEERGNNINTVCLDHQQRPYLPATTLRGFLRERADAAGLGADFSRRLFGWAEGDEGEGGALRLYDACFHSSPAEATGKSIAGWHPERATAIRHGVAINAVTGTVEEHKLFVHELVPVGTQFRLTLEADDLAPALLPQLIGLLASWDGSEHATVGKGRSLLQGRLEWQRDSVQVVDKASLREWLKDSSNAFDSAFRTLAKAEAAPLPAPTGLTSLTVEITPTGPLLVNEAELVSEEEGAPKLEYQRTADNRPLIPGSTLKGLIRARARRILATLLWERAGLNDAAERTRRVHQSADALLNRIFGETGLRSAIWVEDAVGSAVAVPHRQTFNAVDRFTGGVAQSKLYNVNAVVGSEPLTARILSPGVNEEGEWWKGLLLLVARDALDGDLAVGWGKAKGYGSLSVAISPGEGTRLTTWLQLRDHLTRQGHDLQAWVEALHNTVDAAANSKEDRRG